MGAWGELYFENDAACDAYGDIAQLLDPVKRLGKVLSLFDTAGYFEVDECGAAVVCAIFLVATIHPREYQDKIVKRGWLGQYWEGEVGLFVSKWGGDAIWSRKGGEWMRLASKAMATALDKSKLESYELWRECDDDTFNRWYSSMKVLHGILRE